MKELQESKVVKEQFRPSAPPAMEDENYTFKETISDDGKVVTKRVRD